MLKLLILIQSYGLIYTFTIFKLTFRSSGCVWHHRWFPDIIPRQTTQNICSSNVGVYRFGARNLLTRTPRCTHFRTYNGYPFPLPFRKRIIDKYPTTSCEYPAGVNQGEKLAKKKSHCSNVFRVTKLQLLKLSHTVKF